MNTKSEIKAFIEQPTIALVGLSSDEKKFSRMAYKELTKKGYTILPVNPKLAEVDGKKCYADLKDLPPEIKHVLVMTPKEESPKVVKQAITLGIDHIWVQQGAYSEGAFKDIDTSKVNLVANKCILMFASPVKGVHKFHRFIARLFGQVPS